MRGGWTLPVELVHHSLTHTTSFVDPRRVNETRRRRDQIVTPMSRGIHVERTWPACPDLHFFPPPPRVSLRQRPSPAPLHRTLALTTVALFLSHPFRPCTRLPDRCGAASTCLWGQRSHPGRHVGKCTSAYAMLVGGRAGKLGRGVLFPGWMGLDGRGMPLAEQPVMSGTTP